jgi:hypothetical protein
LQRGAEVCSRHAPVIQRSSIEAMSACEGSQFEVYAILGNGLNQAADSACEMTSTPSQKVAPSLTFGNGLWSFQSRAGFDREREFTTT